MLLTALNSIRRRVAGERQTIAPGTVFTAETTEAAEYLAADAAREPTEDELALHQLGRPKPTRAPAVVDAPAATVGTSDAVKPVEALMKMSPKKQGDVYVAVDDAGTVVSGEITFASRAEAVTWIKANPVEADPNAGLLD